MKPLLTSNFGKKIVVTFTIVISLSVLFEKYKQFSFKKLLDKDPYYLLDSTTGHIHNINFYKAIYWPEHKTDSVFMATNNLGFREDENTNYIKADSITRILITGDSHTDGVVNNNESFPNLLEEKLGKNYEVLNGGTGFYSFKNYAGFIDKFKKLNPNVFIVSVYTGNDFIENIFYNQQGIKVFKLVQHFYYRLRKKIFHLNTGLANTQSINQVLFFKLFPKKKEEAVLIAQNYLSQIQKSCKEQNIELIVLFIPTKLLVEQDYKSLVIEKTNWSSETINTNSDLKAQLTTWLTTQEIRNLDLYPFMQNSKTKLFWDADHHLNTEGHKIISEVLYEQLNSK